MSRRARWAPGPIIAFIQAHGRAARRTASSTGPVPLSSVTVDPMQASIATPRSSTLRRVCRRSTPGLMSTGRPSTDISVTEASRCAGCA